MIDLSVEKSQRVQISHKSCFKYIFYIIKELGSANKMYDDFNKIDPAQTEFTYNFCWSRYVFYIKCNIISSLSNN